MFPGVPVAILVAGIMAGAVYVLFRTPLMVVLLTGFMLDAGPTMMALIVLAIATVMIVTPPLQKLIAGRQAAKQGRARRARLLERSGVIASTGTRRRRVAQTASEGERHGRQNDRTIRRRRLRRRARRRTTASSSSSAAYDFDDPKHEWRRLFSELLGTFFLVLVGAGGAVVNAQSGGAIGRAAAVTAPGLMVMAIILFMGAVSGAHLNPAVSIAFAARGDFPWRRVPGYIIVQLSAPRSPASSCGRSSASSACSARPSRARASTTGRRCSSSSS